MLGSSSSSRATSSASTVPEPSAETVNDGPVRFHSAEMRLAMTLPM